jgi:hypothetical protein
MTTSRFIAVFFLGAVILSVFSGHAAGQASGRGTISGYVFGPQRSPLGQVIVELRNDVNMVVSRTRTNGGGQFTFFGVPNGRFSVTVLPLGTNLEGQSQDVEIAGIGVRGTPIPGNAQVDFYLKPRSAPGPPQISEVVFAQDVPEEAERAYEAAISDLGSERVDQGLKGLQRSIEIFPTYYLALERLGRELIKLANYEEAVKTCSAAVAINPRSFSCWYGISFGNFSLNNWQAAIDSALKALEIDKNSINTLIVLGISQRSLRQFEEAETSLLRAKSLDKTRNPDIYWNLALLYTHNLKKYQDAADALELYLKANTAMPEAEKRKIRTLIKRLRENRMDSE